MITSTANDTTGSIGILGTGSYRPARVVTNEEVGEPAGVGDDWIRTKTGIRERRWAKPDEATSDMAVAAAREAMRAAGVRGADLSLVVVATTTPDSPQPPTASVVAHEIGAGAGAAAFDVNVVCSGFVYGLTVGESLLRSAGGGYALVIGADMYSRILDPTDRRTVVLFGDAAGAVVLGPARGSAPMRSRLVGVARDRDLIGVAAGGSRLPTSPATLARGDQYFRMNGRGVREFVMDRVPDAIREFLAEVGLTPGDLDWLVPHQANGRIVEDLADAVGLPRDRVCVTYEDSGNTSAASIPLTLARAVRLGQVRAGDRVLLVTFGGGMALGLALVTW